jgi:hypothetical protein
LKHGLAQEPGPFLCRVLVVYFAFADESVSIVTRGAACSVTTSRSACHTCSSTPFRKRSAIALASAASGQREHFTVAAPAPRVASLRSAARLRWPRYRRPPRSRSDRQRVANLSLRKRDTACSPQVEWCPSGGRCCDKRYRANLRCAGLQKKNPARYLGLRGPQRGAQAVRVYRKRQIVTRSRGAVCSVCDSIVAIPTGRVTSLEDRSGRLKPAEGRPSLLPIRREPPSPLTRTVVLRIDHQNITLEIGARRQCAIFRRTWPHRGVTSPLLCRKRQAAN